MMQPQGLIRWFVCFIVFAANTVGAESEPDSSTLLIACNDHIEIKNAASGYHFGKTGRVLGPYASEALALINSRGVSCHDGSGCVDRVCPRAWSAALSDCEREIEEQFADDDQYRCDPREASNPICHEPPFRGCEKRRVGGNCEKDLIEFRNNNLAYFSNVTQVGAQWFVECSCFCRQSASGVLKMGCSDCERLS